MYKTSTAGILVGIMTAVIFTATTATSVFAIPPNPSYQGNQQGGANMLAQLLSGGKMKVGNMTVGLRLGVMVMPLLCISVSGNLSGIPIFGSMITHNMNQSGMITGGLGNQSINGLGAMIKRSGLIPSVCFSLSDAMLLKSMRGIMGGNMTTEPSLMGSK
jgi:hypothetical protein